MEKEKGFPFIKILIVVVVIALLVVVVFAVLVNFEREADLVPTFVCGQDQMIDNDGNRYNTVKIGGICWMTENLRYLPSVSPSAVGSTTDPIYYVYDYQGTNVDEAKRTINFQMYGVLYNWPAAMTACPLGTRLPTDEEFHILERTFATGTCDPNRLDYGCDSAGAALKAAPPAWNGNNSSGFSALPAGFRFDFGSFLNFTTVAYFWSSSESGSDGWRGPHAWRRSLSGRSTVQRIEIISEEAGYSVRCVR